MNCEFGLHGVFADHSTVLDSSGAVIARAPAEQTGISLATDCNETGVYRFDAVDLGDLTVERTGFKTFQITATPRSFPAYVS